MEYTLETAYEAMKSGAKNETGDPVRDWIFNNKKHKHMVRFLRTKYFDQYVHDYKIWDKCNFPRVLIYPI